MALKPTGTVTPSPRCLSLPPALYKNPATPWSSPSPAEPPPFLPQVLPRSSHSRPALWTMPDRLAGTSPVSTPPHQSPHNTSSRTPARAQQQHRLPPCLVGVRPRRSPFVEPHRRRARTLTDDRVVPCPSNPARRRSSLRMSENPMLKTTPNADLCSKSRFELIYEFVN
jgi:hypothetical protein